MAESDPQDTNEDRLPARDVDPESVDSSPDLPLARLAFFITAILLGAAVGLLTLAKTFPHIPTDLRRLGVLIEALESKRPSPEIVVFGNSVIMSGVDTKALSEAIRIVSDFSSRWALRQLVDTQSRMLLRSDLALAKSTFDLFHPQTYEKKIDPAIAERLVQKRIRAYSAAPPAISRESTRLAEQIARNATKLSRQTIFLFPPIHPDLFAAHGVAFLAAGKKFERSLSRAPNTRVIYAMEILDRFLGRVSTPWAGLICFVIGFAACLLWPMTDVPFIYFQF